MAYCRTGITYSLLEKHTAVKFEKKKDPSIKCIQCFVCIVMFIYFGGNKWLNLIEYIIERYPECNVIADFIIAVLLSNSFT